MTTILAVDLGLLSTGVAWADGSDTFQCPPDVYGSDRLDWWHRTFQMALTPHAGADIYLEGAFFHPKHPTGAMGLAELHGVFKLTCQQAGHRIRVVTPSELKKWATGNGNANKGTMAEAAAGRLRPGCRPASSDEVDAICLYEVASLFAEATA